MTIKQALKNSTNRFNKVGIDSAELDAEVLLARVLRKNRAWLYAHPEKKLTELQSKKFKQLVKERSKHKPIAYILKEKYFYGFPFFVDERVLIPRPETEVLVEATLDFLSRKHKKKINLIDVGTGSGAIILSLANQVKTWPNQKRPIVRFFSTEISSHSLQVAKRNAKKIGLDKQVKFLKGNLIEPLPIFKNSKLAIVANLPYITTKQWKNTQPEIQKFEPQIALDGGKDGLDLYRQLFEQIQNPNLVTQLAFAAFEIDPAQTKKMKTLVKQSFPKTKIEIKKDLAGLDRLVVLHF